MLLMHLYLLLQLYGPLQALGNHSGMPLQELGRGGKDTSQPLPLFGARSTQFFHALFCKRRKGQECLL